MENIEIIEVNKKFYDQMSLLAVVGFTEFWKDIKDLIDDGTLTEDQVRASIDILEQVAETTSKSLGLPDTAAADKLLIQQFIKDVTSNEGKE